MSAVALFFHIRPSPTFSTFLRCLGILSLPIVLSFLSPCLPPVISLTLSISLSHTHAHIHTHSLSSLLPSQVSFLTCLFYLFMGSADRLVQDQIKYNYFHRFSSLSGCLSLSLLYLSVSLAFCRSLLLCVQHHTKFTSSILIYKFSVDAVAFDEIYTVFLACSLL